MSWTEYWNADNPTYVSERHKAAHYAAIARDIAGHLPDARARVVDYGCGEALFAGRVADACGHLYLCDAASRVRERLAQRYAGRGNISVIDPEGFAALGPGTVDLIVVNSVVQYLSAVETMRLLALAREKLGPGGRLVLADVVPRDIGPLTDALALLRFAAANGFLLAAVAGLVRSFFSGYRRIRQEAGFLQLGEGEALKMLEEAGFAAHRHHPNMGHNARRMTFVASPRP
jgi:SAM-dependent methyltransferase